MKIIAQTNPGASEWGGVFLVEMSMEEIRLVSGISDAERHRIRPGTTGDPVKLFRMLDTLRVDIKHARSTAANLRSLGDLLEGVVAEAAKATEEAPKAAPKANEVLS